MVKQVTLFLEDFVEQLPKDIEETFKDIEVEAGILQEQMYKNGTSLQLVASILEKRYGWLEKGVTSPDNSDLKRAVDIIVKGLLIGHFTEQQFLNAVRATMINPINRKEFGHNSEATQKRKGFDKVMVHTGRFINAIRSKITRG